MDWYVEVIRFERICYFFKSTESIVFGCLFKVKCFLWFIIFLGSKKRKKSKKEKKYFLLYIYLFIFYLFIYVCIYRLLKLFRWCNFI